ncbi:MAG: HEAT repeat domain-containing protein, partial [Acidobacteriota bacterium]
MTAQELLSQLREKGVEVKTSGDDRLVIDAPRGTITEELRSALAANKAELLQILKTEQTRSAPAVATNDETARPLSRPPVSEEAPAKVARKDESAMVAESTAEEINQLQVELTRLRTEEEARRAEVEAARLAAEHSLRTEQERWRHAEEESARRRAEQEKKRIEAEARERAEEETRRQIAERELARAEEEVIRMRAMEETRRAGVEAQMREATQKHAAELNALRLAEEEPARRRGEEERRYLEAEARKKAQEDELRRRAEMRFRAVEEEIDRVQAREAARLQAAEESQRLTEEAARRRAEEEARRHAEVQARSRAEDEARLRAQIEAEMRAEADERRRIEEEGLRRAEEEARRRAEEEAQRLAEEAARRRAEEEARRQAEAEAERQAADEARLRAREQARRQAEEQSRQQAEAESKMKAEAEVRQRAELEARIRAEIEAKIRGEEAERRQAEDARRHEEHQRILAEEAAKAEGRQDYPFEVERAPVDEQSAPSDADSVTETVEWFDVSMETRDQVRAVELAAPLTLSEDHYGAMHDDAGGEFQPVSVPETSAMFETTGITGQVLDQLRSDQPAERAAAVASLPQVGGEDAFNQISDAFDDPSVEVRSAAAIAMFEFQEDRAAAFTRALREGTPERRRKIGSAIASSGLADDAIRNLTGESRDKTYDAFSLLFLMSKAGETQPLMRAIESDPNLDVRLAVVKLLTLSGQPDILTAFRRMAVRGSLPPEVRSAVMEAIYQITS